MCTRFIANASRPLSPSRLRSPAPSRAAPGAACAMRMCARPLPTLRRPLRILYSAASSAHCATTPSRPVTRSGCKCGPARPPDSLRPARRAKLQNSYGLMQPGSLHEPALHPPQEEEVASPRVLAPSKRRSAYRPPLSCDSCSISCSVFLSSCDVTSRPYWIDCSTCVPPSVSNFRVTLLSVGAGSPGPTTQVKVFESSLLIRVTKLLVSSCRTV